MYQQNINLKQENQLHAVTEVIAERPLMYIEKSRQILIILAVIRRSV